MSISKASTRSASRQPPAPGLPTVFHFFGGKGGAGKTTCASAFALSALRRDRSASVLIVSTDPAHSLRDALGRRLPRGLRAVELDAPRAFARWLEAHRAAAADVLEHGTWLDSDDIDALLGLPVPGIDELVGLIEIERLAGARGVSRAYDAVIVDTAPTGHALRLLSAPDTVRAVADLLDALQEEHRVIRERFARIGRAEASDRLIDEIARQARDVAARLRRNDLTRFHWVTLPEPLSIAETKDALEALANRRISVPELIVNRVLTDEGPCPICDRRRAEQRRAIVDIRRTLGKGRRVTLVPALAREPVGLRALASLARDMADGAWPMDFACRERPSAIRYLPLVVIPVSAASTSPLLTPFVRQN